MKIRNNRLINKVLNVYCNKFCDKKEHLELRYTGYQDKLVSGDFVNEVAVFDQNIVTSQGPATPYPFAFKILEVFGKVLLK